MSEVHNLRDQMPGPRLVASRPRADLGALIASRICHDLVNPLGAIAQGVELLSLGNPKASPEMDLIAESVDSANARIRFLRIAFGIASPEQRVARSEVTTTLHAVSAGGRLSYDWEPVGDHPRAEVRAVFLLLQCFERALAYGGQVVVSREGPAWVVTGDGPRLKIEEDLWNGLRSVRGRPPESASLVQFALLPEALADLGRPLSVEIGPERIVARF